MYECTQPDKNHDQNMLAVEIVYFTSAVLNGVITAAGPFLSEFGTALIDSAFYLLLRLSRQPVQ
jgi:hypothetical protein